MENINNDELISIMTSCEKVHNDKFLKIISSSEELLKLAVMLTSDLDLFVRILRTRAGSYSVISILGISDEINTILFDAVIERFITIMTHRESYYLGLKILAVCNVHDQIKLFCSVTLRDALVLSRGVNGCIVLKRVMSTADDSFKNEFLNLVTDHAYWLSRDDLGKSLVKHVLQLDYTIKTTQKNMCLDGLMAEFDEILSSYNLAELYRLVLKLTSKPDLFIDFVKTRRGSLMVQVILGTSEEIDAALLEAIKRNLADVITIRFRFGYQIVIGVMDVFMARGIFEVKRQILDEVAWKALHLANRVASFMVELAIDVEDDQRTSIIASRLQGHYVEFSFRKYGSKVVEKLLGDGESFVALSLMVTEIVKCDEDTLMRFATDGYGNKVLKKTLEFAKKERRVDLFGDLVEKLKPFLDQLRGSQGENIAAIIDSES